MEIDFGSMFKKKPKTSKTTTTKKSSSITKTLQEIDITQYPVDMIYASLLGVGVLCLIILFIALLVGSDGLAKFFGWLGIIACLIDLVIYLLFYLLSSQESKTTSHFNSRTTIK